MIDLNCQLFIDTTNAIKSRNDIKSAFECIRMVAVYALRNIIIIIITFHIVSWIVKIFFGSIL